MTDDSELRDPAQAIFEQALDLEPADREAFLRVRCGDDDELFAEVMVRLWADPVVDRAADAEAETPPPAVPTALRSRLLRGLGAGARHFGRFVARYPVAVATTIGVTILASMILSHVSRVEGERDRAQLEARKSAAVSTFLLSLFKAADLSRGEDVTAREILDQGRARAQKELADQPEVLADLMQTIGNAYHHLGLLEPARSTFEETLDMRRKLRGGEKNPEVVSAMADLASIEVERGEYQQGEALAQRAVEIARKLGDDGLSSLAASLNVLAGAVNLRGRYDESEAEYRESIAAWKRIEGPDSRQASIVTNNLALMLHERSRYSDADGLFREALATQEKIFGKHHPETSATRYNYAQLLADEGHLQEAKAMWEEVLATDRALYPAGHPNIANTLSAYGRLLMRLGEFQEAEKLQREALGIRLHAHGDRHPDVAYSLGALGRVLHEEGRYAEAEKLYRQALAMHLELNGPDHPILGAVMNDIGLLLYDRGDYAAADTVLEKALEFQKRISGGEDQNTTGVSMTRLAVTLAALDRWLEAEALAREGLALTRRVHENQGIWVASALIELGDIRLDMGAIAEAETLFADGLERMRSFEPGAPPRPRDAKALLGLGRCRLARKDPAGAQEQFQAALEIARRYRSADDPNTAEAETAVASALVATGKFSDAEPLLVDAVRIYQATVIPAQIDRVKAEANLRECQQKLHPTPPKKKRTQAIAGTRRKRS